MKLSGFGEQCDGCDGAEGAAGNARAMGEIPRVNPPAGSQFTGNLRTAWTGRNRAVLFQQLTDNGVQCICSVKGKCHLLCLALIAKYRCSDTVAEIFIAHVVDLQMAVPKAHSLSLAPDGDSNSLFLGLMVL